MVMGVIITRKFGNIGLTTIKKYEQEGLARFEKIIDTIGKAEDIKFFTDGHPYVWVEASYEDAKKIVLFSCRGFRNVAIPASFEARADIEARSIYIIVPRGRKFNWESLQHYEAWIKSNEPFAERIAAYKEKR